MPKRTKKSATKTTTKTLEIPITAMPPEALPDGELGQQWNELYPPGTEVIYSPKEVQVPHDKTDGTKLLRLTGKAFFYSERPKGFQDYVSLDTNINEVKADQLRDVSLAAPALRYHFFPASAFPDVAKKLRKHAINNAVAEKLGMKNFSKKSVTKTQPAQARIHPTRGRVRKTPTNASVRNCSKPTKSGMKSSMSFIVRNWRQRNCVRPSLR